MTASTDMAKKGLGRASRRKLAGAAMILAATAALVAVATPASALTPPRSGPGATNIIQSFRNGGGWNVPFRTGNNSFGEQHIRIGGSTGNTANHELSSFAKTQWGEAISKPWITGRFPGAEVYSHQYKTPGGTNRTMCVVVDTNDYTYANSNYGYKGIITAFWINGHYSTATCNSSPG
ncbi:hypothetical protein ACIBF5_02785 [Micromonospora sp. NPDC050417]|uniref:hypothetical protein n=1 Tax=Micromonospora sp. NPDC050417 TaxID=3364280 RepID=UPI0037B9CE33